MNKKNCPNKNKSFLSSFLNLALTVLPRTYCLSFIKKVVLSFFLFLSFSVAGFVSPGINPHCPLPVYLSALQSGMLDGQPAQRGSSVAAQKEGIRKKMTWYAEEAGRYKKAIGDLDDEIDKIEKRLSNDFGEGGDHVVDQIIDHITGEQSQEYGDENLCFDEEREKMDVYYRKDKSSYFAKLSSVLEPPPFSFTLLHKIAQTSLSQMIPAAVAETITSSDECSGKKIGHVVNPSTSKSGFICTCVTGGCEYSEIEDEEKGPPCLGVSGGHCKQNQTCCDYGIGYGCVDGNSCPEEPPASPPPSNPDGGSTGTQCAKGGTTITCASGTNCCEVSGKPECHTGACPAPTSAGTQCAKGGTTITCASGTNCCEVSGKPECHTGACPAPTSAGTQCAKGGTTITCASGTNCCEVSGKPECHTGACPAPTSAGTQCAKGGTTITCASGTNCCEVSGKPECHTGACPNSSAACAEGDSCTTDGEDGTCDDAGKCIAAGAPEDDEATQCDHWRRWRECAEDDGEIKKKKLCGSPGDCRYRGGTLPLVDVFKEVR